MWRRLSRIKYSHRPYYALAPVPQPPYPTPSLEIHMQGKGPLMSSEDASMFLAHTDADRLLNINWNAEENGCASGEHFRRKSDN